MNRFNQLQWPLIVGMGAFACIRPFMNITGVMDLLGRPTGPILMAALISVVWLAIVVLFRVRQPILTLTLTGVVYGAFAIILGAILSPLLTGELWGPLANPLVLSFAVGAILITNALWGLAVGLVAWSLQQATGRRNQHPA